MTKINELARADIVADNDLVPIWDTLNKDTRAATMEAVRSGGLRAELAASSGSGLVGHIATGTGAVARTAQDKLRDSASVKDFGAVGDGVTDDTAAVQAAISANYGKRLYFPEGTYKVTAGLVATAGIWLDIDPGAVLDFSGMAAGTSLGGRIAITASGSRGSDVTVTADIARGATVVSVSSTAGLSADDWIVVRSDQRYSDGAAAGLATRGHMAQIASVDSGTQITLRERVPFSYVASSNARIAKLALVSGLVITGGTIRLGGVGSVHNGIRVNYGLSPTVSGTTVIAAEDAGISFADCVSPAVIDSRVTDSTSPGGALGNTGYGVAIYGGHGGRIQSCVMTRCRHGVAGGGGFGTVSIGAKVADCDLFWCGLSTWALDCHEPCFNWVFTGNTVHGGNGGAILRGPGTVFDGNAILDVLSSGVQVQQFNDNTDGLPDILVSNNRVYNCGGGGIWVYGHTVTTDKMVGVVIADNIVTSAGDHAIYGRYCVGLQISNNSVRDQVGSGRSGVYVSNCTDVSIAGGRLDLSAASNGAAIYVDTCTGVRIADVTLRGSASATNQDGIRAVGSTVLCVSGVIAGGMSRYAIYTTTTDRVLITHNDVRDSLGGTTKILVSGATSYIVDNNIDALVNIPIRGIGSGSPESVVAAPVGSTFQRTNGGTSTTLYVKETGGTGNTGWVAK